MATLGLGTSHLQCAKLSEAAVNLLEPFATWLSALKFSPHAGGFETLVHPQLVEKINPLLTELGLLQKVQPQEIHVELQLNTRYRSIR